MRAFRKYLALLGVDADPGTQEANADAPSNYRNYKYFDVNFYMFWISASWQQILKITNYYLNHYLFLLEHTLERLY